MTKLVAVLGVCALVGGAVRPALAVTAAEKCAQSKQKAAGEKIAGKMGCFSKAQAKNLPPPGWHRLLGRQRPMREIVSRGRGPRGGPPLPEGAPEGANVVYARQLPT